MEREELQRETLGRCAVVARGHYMAMRRFVEERGLEDRQYWVLMVLAKEGDGLSQREIAKKLHVTPAAVSVQLKKLEKSGIISKRVLESDNRYNEIYVTPKGKQIVKESEDAFSYINSCLFEGVSDTEVFALYQSLDRILQNISASMEKEDSRKKAEFAHAMQKKKKKEGAV